MKRILFFVVVIASLVVINGLLHSIFSLWQKRSLVTQTKQELTKEQQENQKLKAEMAKTKKPQFIEEEARDKLLLVKPGEQVVILPSPSPAPQVTIVRTTHETNWQQWWQLFFHTENSQ